MKITFTEICVLVVIGIVLWVTWPNKVEETLLRFDTKVRAYCPCEVCTDGDFITADGSVVGGLGIASSVFDFGTKIAVDGYGIGVVNDRGPGVVEVYFDDHDVAKEWGVKNLRVRVVR